MASPFQTIRNNPGKTTAIVTGVLGTTSLITFLSLSQNGNVMDGLDDFGLGDYISNLTAEEQAWLYASIALLMIAMAATIGVVGYHLKHQKNEEDKSKAKNEATIESSTEKQTESTTTNTNIGTSSPTNPITQENKDEVDLNKGDVVILPRVESCERVIISKTNYHCLRSSFSSNLAVYKNQPLSTEYAIKKTSDLLNPNSEYGLEKLLSRYSESLQITLQVGNTANNDSDRTFTITTQDAGGQKYFEIYMKVGTTPICFFYKNLETFKRHLQEGTALISDFKLTLPAQPTAIPTWKTCQLVEITYNEKTERFSGENTNKVFNSNSKEKDGALQLALDTSNSLTIQFYTNQAPRSFQITKTAQETIQVQEIVNRIPQPPIFYNNLANFEKQIKLWAPLSSDPGLDVNKSSVQNKAEEEITVQ